MDIEERNERIRQLATTNPLLVPASAIDVGCRQVTRLAKTAANLSGKGDYLEADARLEAIQHELAKISRQVGVMRGHIAKVS